MNYELLRKLCAIPSTAGDEGEMAQFILKYLCDNNKSFKTTPQVFSGAGFQDMVIAVFGEPRTAIFAHTDTVAYCTAYDNELVKIGNPKAADGTRLKGYVDGKIENAVLKIKKTKKRGKNEAEAVLKYSSDAKFAPGTPLTYAPDWKETKQFVKSAYMDNRLGVWNALQQAHNIEHGALVFSTYEEHGGGGAQFAGRFLQENFGIQQALISDVTLLTKHMRHKKGPVISMRDRGIPRQSYVRRIISIAEKHNIPHQLEVEKAGGSDGNALQDSSYAWDWGFIGPVEDNYHCPGEKVAKEDIEGTVKLYAALIEEL
jgi:putative aminopeptidase FrvX